MRKLDLHGKKHEEVLILIEDFILENQRRLPIKVITGNSKKMKGFCFEILDKYEMKYFVPSHNLGEIIILQ
jgi:DNA-nicking Smr family endonuclease